MGASVIVGNEGPLGLFLGAGVSLFSVITLERLTSLLVHTLPESAQGARTAVLMLLLKLPVFIVAVLLATRLSTTGLAFFLVGVGVVYFCTVWFLAWSPNRDNRT